MKTDVYFWLGDDGEAIVVSEEGFGGLQDIERDARRRFREVDTSPKRYYFHGIIEEIDEDDYDDEGYEFDDLFDDDSDDTRPA